MRARTVVLVIAALTLGACTGPETEGTASSLTPTAADTPRATMLTPPPRASPPQTDPVDQRLPVPGEAATTPATPSAGPTVVDWAVTEVARDLAVPWSLTFAADGTGFFSQRDTGAVNRLAPDGAVEEIHRLEPDPSGEGGLLGLAAAPDEADRALLYAYLSTADDNRVVRFMPGQEAEVVLDGIPAARIHNGGRIAFGPDGMLYIGTGDAGQGARAQDPDSLAGKILRVRPDGSVPEDNPTDGSPVWSLGHRNVQGFDWDAEGRMYATEFGPDVDDEINLIEPGGNYGWPEVTGQAGVDGYIDPLLVMQPSEASWSGAAVLTGGAIPQWEGDLFAASLRGQRLWRVDLDDGGVADTEALLESEYGRLRVVVQGPDGALWLSTSNRDGRGSPSADDDRILRLGPAG